MRNKRRRGSQKKGWTSGATKDGGEGGGLKTEYVRMETGQYRIDVDITSLQSSVLGLYWHLLKRLGLARGQRSMLFSVWKVGDIFKSSNYLLLLLLLPLPLPLSLSLSISQGRALKIPGVEHIVLSSSLWPVKRRWVQTEAAAADGLLPLAVIKQQSSTYKVKGLNTELSNSRNMIIISRKEVDFCLACQSFSVISRWWFWPQSDIEEFGKEALVLEEILELCVINVSPR